MALAGTGAVYSFLGVAFLAGAVGPLRLKLVLYFSSMHEANWPEEPKPQATAPKAARQPESKKDVDTANANTNKRGTFITVSKRG